MRKEHPALGGKTRLESLLSEQLAGQIKLPNLPLQRQLDKQMKLIRRLAELSTQQSEQLKVLSELVNKQDHRMTQLASFCETLPSELQRLLQDALKS
jgi:hypothetical protein